MATISAAPARAQDTPPDHEPPPEALVLYQHGRELYLEGRYRDAVGELERALRIDPTSPNLVYDVARLHELLGELPDAIRYYERYLAVLPHDETAELERTRGTITRLRGAQRVIGTRRPPPAAGGGLRHVRAEVRIVHGMADEVFWTTTAFAGATLVAATVVGVLAVVRDQSVAAFVADGTTTPGDRATLVSEVHALSLAADVLFGVSAVAALSAAVLYFLRDRVEVVVARPHDAPSGAATLSPFVSTNRTGVSFGLEGLL